MVELDDRREFVAQNGDKYYLTTPSAEDVRGADWTYSKFYTKSLMEGIPTAAEMTDILTRRGIIGIDFEKRSTELSQELGDNLMNLEMASTFDSKREYAVKVAESREALFQWQQRLNGPMNNTCEQMSDNARLEFLTACITQNTDGTKLWNSYDAYLKTKDRLLAREAKYQVMLMFQGFSSDFLEKTPEYIAIKEVEDAEAEIAKSTLKAIEAVRAEQEQLSIEKEIEEVEGTENVVNADTTSEEDTIDESKVIKTSGKKRIHKQ